MKRSKGTRVAKYPNGAGKRAPKQRITGRDSIPVPVDNGPKTKVLTAGTVVGRIDKNSRETRMATPGRVETAVHGESARTTLEAPRNKPNFQGMFVGHTVYADRKRKTGQSLLYTREDGSKGQFSVKRNESDACWVWDGREWVADNRINVG